MRSIKRFFLGGLSSLLVGAGLARAAQNIEPMMSMCSVNASIHGTAPDAVTESWIDNSQA